MTTTVEQVEVPVIDPAGQFERQREKLLEAATEVLESGYYVGGSAVEELETQIAGLCGVDHAVAMNSGTDALQLALEAAGVRGGEVILPSFTFFACVEAVVRAGATPVFADIDPETYNLDPERAAEQITNDSAALMPVHLYGQPAEMDSFRELAEAHDLFLLEDMAQAIGAEWDGDPAGSLGHAGAISFYPTKNLGGFGDGGMLVTDDANLAERADSLSDHGQEGRYNHERIGANSRMDALQAALLGVKLERLSEITEDKRAIAARYREGLTGTPVELPTEHDHAKHVYHQFTVQVDERDRVHEQLRDSDIGSMVYYPQPAHTQAALDGTEFRAGPLPHTENIAERCLSLPSYPEMTEAQTDWVIHRLSELTAGLEG